jgi:hypothetical protein
MKSARIPELVLASLVFTSWQATAACVDITACYRVDGEVSECEESFADGERFLRVSLRNSSASRSECGFTPHESPAPEEIEDRLADLNSSSTFFIQDSDGIECKSLVGKPVAANVRQLCCDTYPARGACTLSSPVLGLRDVN